MSSTDEVRAEAARRRTFAVISHPDAGKSTLTEALALHASAIQEAGHIHAKAGRKSTVSDWNEMEKARGISITSTALQLNYEGHVLNLVDTPGHADFSEDTYRVLSAVDAAVMLLDAAKGLEPQTLKLFQVCRHRGIPILTVVNKWDRPGKSALALLDEIEERIGIRPTPLTWPVGEAGEFQGTLQRRSGDMVRYTRTAGGAHRAPEETLTPEQASRDHKEAWRTAVEESELLSEIGADHDQETFLSGETTPTLFTAAVLNFGVKQLLDTLVELGPAPSAPQDVNGAEREVTRPFSAFVFKVQAGMDTAHRDRLAYARVTTGRFERGMVVTNARTKRPLSTKYAQSVFGQERSTLDEAYPGDVIGLVNALGVQVGDTLYEAEPVTYPPIPSFAPEHFRVCRAKDTSRYKQFQRGIEQLEQEGVVQVLRSDLRGVQAPVLAAVGPMQFEVVEHRMETELSAPVTLDPLGYNLARKTTKEWAGQLDAVPGVEVLERGDGTLLALFPDKWRLSRVAKDLPEEALQPLVATTE